MQMTESEIKVNVLQARDQKAQVKICAELNGISVDKIREILKRQGVDLRRLRGGVSKRIAETKPHKSKSADVVPCAVTLPEAMAAIRAELDDINRQQYELDMRKADLYKQLWDTLGEVER